MASFQTAAKQRQQRALKLLARRPQAAPLLEFYVELLDLQQGVLSALDGTTGLEAAWAPEGEFPRLRLDRLPVASLVEPFADFCGRAAERGTEVLQQVAAALQSAAPPLHEPVLSAYLAREELDAQAKTLGCDPLQLAFFPRAFLMPILETLAAEAGEVPEDWQESFCPACGSLPQVGVLLDDKLIKSRRLLECGLCATRWPIRRGICAHCGETDAEKLQHHTTEDLPAVRIDACATCNAYLKTIDTRKDGLAVPVVDELATVELDLWADEQGLWKITPNLLGV